jgi:hypothetical protein
MRAFFEGEMTKALTIIECPSTDHFHTNWHCDLTDRCALRKAVDHAEIGAGTEIYNGEEAAVLKSPIFGNLNPLRNGDPLNRAPRKPSQPLQRGVETECEGFGQ